MLNQFATMDAYLRGFIGGASHDKRHQSDVFSLHGRQSRDFETLRYRLCDRSCRRDVWLGDSLLVDYRQVSEVADRLA